MASISYAEMVERGRTGTGFLKWAGRRTDRLAISWFHHAALKSAASASGRTLRKVTEEAVEDWLKKEDRRCRGERTPPDAGPELP